MNTNDWQNGYNAGYQNGWEAGYNRGKTEGLPKNPYQQGQQWPSARSVGTTCFVCGRFFEAGKAYGLVCSHAACPSKAYCSTTAVATSVGTTSSTNSGESNSVFVPWYSVNASSAVPDGLSYEEIYGSVIYQQNKNKKE